MRVCLVSIHPRMLSGQINSLVGLTHALRARDNEVEIVTAFPQSELLDIQRIYRTEARAGVLLSKLGRLPAVIQRLRHASAQADVVQLNLPSPAFSLLGDAVQAILGRPIVVGFEMHLPTVADVLGPRLLAAPQFYLPQVSVNNRAIALLSSFSAARYVVASRLQAAELVSLGASADRVSVIPNVVDSEQLAGDVADAGVAWPRGGPIIGYAGHFNHVKGVDVLVRALPEVVKQHPGAQLVLAWTGLGPVGPIQDAIRSTGMPERVHVVGRLPVGDFIRRSTVLALPYRLTMGQAAYPGLLLEALTTGVPLVTSDLPLLQELVAQGETAELARPEDSHDLAQRIVRLLDDPAYCLAMIQSQHQFVHRVIDPNLLARRYEAMYEDVYAQPYRSNRQAQVLPAATRSRGI
jgi:glycosyltransferase involved in cell wall biosynthesis